MNKKSINKNKHGKPEISSDLDIALTSSKWFGALVFYIINLGKVPLKEFWTKKYSKRNLWVGYFVKIVFLVATLVLAWKLYLKDILYLH
ncbi:hypothetical protein [Hwangdonia lutea]|uniref:Uncharacterized protein n=1 Tax=Hwangdonia lutea TaxID=3075823 RepID=A0AA97HNS1_9FLAO|nr:hypothetical protein [Hwangdonia sp. SCSIO 19198]WOD42331.1 hypothetical protein RNZ46_10005 [Hwangdonia sp. SCSIO 19198]